MCGNWMSVKKNVISLILMLSAALPCDSEAASVYGIFTVHGSTSPVGFSDLLSDRGRMSEGGLRKLCAEITGRYHERGYTAFYVKRAVLNSDGTAELYFDEGRVAHVIVTGDLSDAAGISASVFPEGELFNEFILKENITETKRRFDLKKINVTASRGEGDLVLLSVHASEKMHELETVISNSPVYGIIPEFKYRFSYGSCLAGVSFGSSFNQFDRSVGSGTVFLRVYTPGDGSYFNITAEGSEKRDPYTAANNHIYSSRSFESKAGYCFIDGAVGIQLNLAYAGEELKSYPGENGGISFSGLHLGMTYDNRAYKIDYADSVSAGIDFYAGWNFIEEGMTEKAVLRYIYNIPFYPDFFLSLNGNGSYTTDSGRYSHEYVYDGNFPCRDNDFSTASFRSTAGADIAYEAMERTLYILAGGTWGVDNSGEDYHNVFAPSLKLLVEAGSARMDLSYMYDYTLGIRDGFLKFSVSAVY